MFNRCPSSSGLVGQSLAVITSNLNKSKKRKKGKKKREDAVLFGIPGGHVVCPDTYAHSRDEGWTILISYRTRAILVLLAFGCGKSILDINLFFLSFLPDEGTCQCGSTSSRVPAGNSSAGIFNVNKQKKKEKERKRKSRRRVSTGLMIV